MTKKQALKITEEAYEEFESSGSVYSLTDFEEAVRFLTLLEE